MAEVVWVRGEGSGKEREGRWWVGVVCVRVGSSVVSVMHHAHEGSYACAWRFARVGRYCSVVVVGWSWWVIPDANMLKTGKCCGFFFVGPIFRWGCHRMGVWNQNIFLFYFWRMRGGRKGGWGTCGVVKQQTCSFHETLACTFVWRSCPSGTARESQGWSEERGCLLAWRERERERERERRGGRRSVWEKGLSFGGGGDSGVFFLRKRACGNGREGVAWGWVGNGVCGHRRVGPRTITRRN